MIDVRVLVAGVGYSNLRDLSVGPILAARLARLTWPAGVEVDDLSFGPIAVAQRFQAQAGSGRPYDRVVLLAAASRGRAPGYVAVYSWGGRRSLPAPEEIQARIGEAVTGVISLDNLLIIGEHFDIWPHGEVLVVEVEPEDTGWGPGFSPAVERVVDPVMAVVRQAALSGYAWPAEVRR
jgi:hydrogenase maturation protease